MLFIYCSTWDGIELYSMSIRHVRHRNILEEIEHIFWTSWLKLLHPPTFYSTVLHIGPTSLGNVTHGLCCRPKPEVVLTMQIYHPHPASAPDMTKFHAEDYIEFLQNVTPENKVCLATFNLRDCTMLVLCHQEV